MSSPRIFPRTRNWHPADIVAAIRKRGLTLQAIAHGVGLSGPYLSNACRVPSSGAEQAIAKALGLEPRDIWPERFWPDGSRRHGNQKRVKLEQAQARLAAARKEKGRS